MNKYQNKNFLFICLLFPVFLFAKENIVKEKKVIICGESDSAISIEIIKHPVYFINQSKFSINYNVSPINGNFSFHLPGIKEPTYITILFHFASGNQKGLVHFLITSGDSVYIKEGSIGIQFSGKSGPSFECQMQMIEARKIKPTNLMAITNLYQHAKETKDKFDTLSEKRLKILASFKADMNKKVYQVLQTDCLYEKLSLYYADAEFEFLVMRKDSTKQNQIIQYYLDNYAHQKIDTTNAHILLYSKFYIDYILNKIKFDYLMKTQQYKPAASIISPPPWLDLLSDKY